MGTIIRWLKDGNDSSVDHLGGKGANLAELMRAGFVVPPGFVISTDAYRTFVKENAIQSRLPSALVQYRLSHHPDVLEQTSAEIRALFSEGIMPSEVREAISAAYHDLNHNQNSSVPAVAVRSSATTEDLPGLTFAGQQDTYLNIIDEHAVLDAVKRCWGSLWTDRAMAYRARNRIPPDEVALAVIVQEMVPAQVSGVLFTANPVTGRRDEMVVDASFGLGEAIVSGQVDPDHYTIDSRTWQVTKRKIGTKAVAILPSDAGGTVRVGHEAAPEQALPDAQIITLAQTASRVEDTFGTPQDIEWAWANERLYLLQSRPITTLYPIPPSRDDGLRVYANFNFTQGVPDPLTPLGMDVFRFLMSGLLVLFRIRRPADRVLPDAGNRLFLDLTELVRDQRLRSLALDLLRRSDPSGRQILARLIGEGRFPTQRVLSLRRGLSLFLAVLPILRRVLMAMLAPERTRMSAIAGADQFLAQCRQQARAAMGLSERLRAMEMDLFSAAEEVSLPAMPLAFLAIILIQVVDGWLAAWLGEKPGTALQLMRGLPFNITTEMDLKLWAVAGKIRGDPEAAKIFRDFSADEVAAMHRQGRLPPAAQQPLDGFLREYGMRGVAEIDIGRPRWRDDPTPLIQTLQSYLDIHEPDLAPDVVFKARAREAEYLAQEFIARSRRSRFGWLRAVMLAGAIRRMRALGGLREIPLYYLVCLVDLYRSALLESGRDLADHGRLIHAEDIFWVPLATLKRFAQGEAIDLQDVVAAQRPVYERERLRRQIPHILLSTGEAFYEGANDMDAATDELVGESVSPGVVEGTAHVIFDPHGARLEPGEILVCPATDPGWTPLFLVAGGLVMEIGGLITHGSVVAREYGIPAVVGVHNATERLHTGQRIRVDGNRGRVTVLDEEQKR